MRYTLAAPLSMRNLGRGGWQLTDGGSGALEVYLRGAGSSASEILQESGSRGAGNATLELEWRDGRVAVTLTGATGVGRLNADSAIVHEPRGSLYENLPLAAFDANAVRFWKRVFRLMRVPGGRFLLGLIARRNR